MPRSKPSYPRHVREEAVRLVQTSGRSIARIARELGIAHGTLSAWVKQAELDAGPAVWSPPAGSGDSGRLRRRGDAYDNPVRALRRAAG